MSITITVYIANQEVPIQVNKDKDTIQDIINEVIRKTKKNIIVTIITIGGIPIEPKNFSQPINNFELDDGYAIYISEYYDGGNIFYTYINSINKT